MCCPGRAGRHRGTGGFAAGRRVVGLYRRRRRPLHVAADPRRGTAPGQRRGTPRRVSRRRVDGRSGSAGDGGEQNRPGSRAGFTGPPDVHLRGTAAACDRTGRHRQNHRHACPHPGLDPRRRPGARPRPVRCRSRRPCRAHRHPHRHTRQTHLVPTVRRTARLGGSDRAVDLGDHRRSRHGRHPLPRHRRPVRHRSRCERPADRR